MFENKLHFYLEDIPCNWRCYLVTESTRNTNRVKELKGIKITRLSETEQKNKLISHCLKLSGARKIVFEKDNDEPCDSDAEYDSDPDSEAEPDFDCDPVFK